MAIKASELTLEEVSRLLKFEERFDNSISSLLTLEPLTDFEEQELLQIRNLYRRYYKAGKISEGQIKFLFVARLMWLAGFYQPEIEITLEEGIAEISVEDEDKTIKGRMDILAVNRTETRIMETLFWILVIEAKNSSFNAMEGLPQLLTYAYKSLEHQDYIWGLTTNGMDYRFVHIQAGIPTYQLIPALNLIDYESAIQILQVLRAICKQQNTALSVPAVTS